MLLTCMSVCVCVCVYIKFLNACSFNENKKSVSVIVLLCSKSTYISGKKESIHTTLRK